MIFILLKKNSMNKQIIFFLLIASFCVGQNEVDSLSYYHQKGDYSKAIIYGEKQKKTFKIKDTEYAIIVNNLASAYGQIGDFKNAELNYLEKLELEKSFFGKNHKIVANTYHNLGLEAYNSYNLQRSKKYYEEAIQIFKSISSSKTLDYSNCIFDYATLLRDLKDYKNADLNYKESIQLNLDIEGDNSINYYDKLFSYGIFLEKNKENIKAEEYFLKVYNFQKNNLNKIKISKHILCINIIANYYNEIKNYDLQEIFLNESIELQDKYFGKFNIEYVKSLTNLGMLYSYKNEFNKSSDCFLNVSKILEKSELSNSVENAFILERLGALSYQRGNYKDSENFYKRAINVYELNSKFNEAYNSSISLAYNYSSKGDYNSAEQIYMQLLTKNDNPVIKFSLHEKLIEMYIDLNNSTNINIYFEENEKLFGLWNESIKNERNYNLKLSGYFRLKAIYYSYHGDYKKALEFGLKRIDLISADKDFDLLKPAYSVALSDVGIYYKMIGDYDNWVKYKFKALENFKQNESKVLNEASLLIDIADIYFLYKRDIVIAKKYYNDALHLIETKLSINTQLYDNLLLKLAMFYREINDENAYLILDKILIKNKLDINKYSSFLTSKELTQVKYLVERGNNMIFHDFNFEKLKNKPELNISSFNNQLLLKNLTLRNQLRIKNSIARSNNIELKDKYEQFIDNTRYLTKQDELPLLERASNYETIKNATDNLEKDITRLSSEFADAKKALSINWKQVQEKLKPNEIAIDLVVYNYYNKKWTDSVYYSAFIITKDSKFPKFNTLFEEKQLKSLLSKNSNPNDKIRNNKLYTEKAISDLFLKPLENELKNISTVYLSPSGLGHQIDFNALPINENQLFGEKYKVHVLSSPSELIDYKSATLNPKNNLELILYGGIDYNVTLAKEKQIENNDSVTSNTIYEELGNRAGYSKLDGTLKEVEEISQNAQKNGFNSKLFKEGNATEESIKALDGNATPYVLHIATHGFFFENIKQEIPKDVISIEKKHQSFEDPMQRSGLLLAGANKFWTKTNEKSTTDDGILTASEISNLDLSACQLVVLSACETGLGQINGSEGVFGLQRAFKMAGVKNIIMSLWKVPDDQTAELFNLFYEECFAGKTMHDAFQIAQTKMKVKYAPYYWAGFILLE
jgi:CHAT domain-containing protein/tetratricopeptide (TPR) repeat protein